MAGNYQEFINYFKDKRVAVIGSGSSILKKEYGPEIDAHDVIVRINRGYPYERYRKHVGTRTDVWSFGMGGREDLRSKMHNLFSDRKYSMYCWFESSWVPPYLRAAPNHITLPPQFSRKAMVKCGGTPATTGLDTIHFLVTGTQFKELSVYGIDNYTTEYWFIEEDDSVKITTTTEEGKAAHTPSAEANFLQEMVDNNSNIRWIK